MKQPKFILITINILIVAFLLGTGCKRDFKNPIRTSKDLQSNELFQKIYRNFYRLFGKYY